MATKDGAIEIAVNSGYVFTNASNDDLLIRTTTSNQSIHFGTYSNDRSAMYINSNSVTITSNLYISNYVSVGTSNTFSRINVDGGINMTGNIYKNNNLYITDSNTVLGLFKVGLPIKQQFQSSTTQSNFTITMAGDFTADVTATDVYLNGNKLAYVNAVTNDYILNVNRTGMITDFIISLGQNVYSGDVVDITIWPSMSNFFAQNTFFAACNLTPVLSGASGFNSNNLQIYQTFALGNTTSTEAMTVSAGNALFNSNLYVMRRIGIGASNPAVSLDITGTDSILLPKGTTAQRPAAPVQGYVRYNTDINTFEGYGAGNAWGSLGGVKDTNQDTFIAAESFPTSNDDALRFINSNNESMRIIRGGFVGISNIAPSERLELSGGNAKFNSNIYILNRLGIGASNPAVSLDITGTDSILLPKGTTAQRPAAPVQGYVRYNTDINTFEGYGAGNAWGSLGGVKDTNQDTFIGAESFPTSNDDALRFINSNNESMRIIRGGFVGISNIAPSERLELSGGNAKFNSNVYVLVNLGIGTSNPTVNMEVNGSAKVNSNLTVMGNLTVSGVTTTVNSTSVLIADNMLTLNNGAVFNSGLQAGIEINRGTGYSNYYFVFDEATKYFKIGQTGALQTVATREDSPAANGTIPYYDNTTFRYLSANTFVYSSGRLGINQASPGYTLDVGGTIRTTAGGGDALLLDAGGSYTAISFSNNKSAIASIGLSYASGQYSTDASSNDLIIRNAFSGGKVILQNGLNSGAIVVNSNNFVGIGTSTPTYRLHVNGNVLLRNTTDTWQTGLNFNSDNTSNSYSFNLGNSANTAIGANAFGVYDNSTVINRFVTVWKGGNVGIGTTSPSAQLEVSSTAIGNKHLLLSGKSFFNQASDSDANGILILNGVNATNNRQLWFMDSTAGINATCAAFRIGLNSNALPVLNSVSTNGTVGLKTEVQNFWSSTNFGFGTSSPNGRLQVIGDGTNPAISIDGVSRDIGYAGNLQFGTWDGTNWSEKMRLDSSGLLGIGTASPATPLDILTTSIVAGGGGCITVTGSNNNERLYITSVGGDPVVRLNRTNGTVAAQTAITSNQSLGMYQFGGHNGSGTVRTAWIQAFSTENYSATNNGTCMTFCTTPNGTTNLTERVRIDQSGYVGIGTSTPSVPLDVTSVFGNTNAKFGIANPLYIINTDPIVGFNAYYNNAWYNGGTSTGYMGCIGFSGGAGNFYIQSTPGTVASGATTATMTTRLSILNSGRIGFNTGSAESLLHLFDSTASASNTLIVQNSTQSNVGVLFRCRDGSMGATNYDASRIETGWESTITPYSSSYIKFQTHSTNTAAFTNDVIIKGGNVGIGTTSPSFKLHNALGSVFIGDIAYASNVIPSVAPSITPANGYRLVFDNTYNVTAGSGMAANKIVLHNNNFLCGLGIETNSVTYHSGGHHTFYVSTTNASTYGTSAMIINSSGNVGIGTTSPHSQAKLHLAGTGVLNQMHFSATDQATDTKNWAFGPNGSTFYAYTWNDAYSTSANWMQVTRSANTISSVNFPNGAVGIGTTTAPNSGVVRLEVSSTSATYLRISGAVGSQQAIEFYDNASRWINYKQSNGTDLRWYNGSSDVMTLLNNGRLGLGTTSPGTRFHVSGGTTGDWCSRFEHGSVNSYLSHSSGYGALITTGTTSSSTYALLLHNGSDIFTVRNDGNVGVGIAFGSISYKLHVAGDIYASADVIAYSDSNVKTDLQRITNAVDKLEKINGYTFKRTDLSEDEPHKRHTGLIAQEVQKILPEAVHTDSQDRLSIAYGNMAGIIIEAIKELKDELRDIKKFIGMP